jgi:hypothetical protein
MQLSESVEGLPSQGREDGRTAKTVYFLENYIAIDSWPCRYIRVICSYVSRTKQGIETRVLWRISRYHGMCNFTDEESHKLRSLQPSTTVLKNIKWLTKGSLLTRHPLNSTCNQSGVF